MMNSTPVRFSSARMLRPSRPMIRPFMSSDGSWTSETVVSAAWLAATRWRASDTRLRARCFASACASSSIWRTIRAISCLTSSSERVEQLLARFVDRQSRDPFQLSQLAGTLLLGLGGKPVDLPLAVAERLIPALELAELLVDLSPPSPALVPRSR